MRTRRLLHFVSLSAVFLISVRSDDRFVCLRQIFCLFPYHTHCSVCSCYFHMSQYTCVLTLPFTACAGSVRWRRRSAAAEGDQVSKTLLQNRTARGDPDDVDVLATKTTYQEVKEEMDQMNRKELQVQMAKTIMLRVTRKNKKSIIEELQASGTVSPEELHRLNTDDAFLELKLRKYYKQIMANLSRMTLKELRASIIGLLYTDRIFGIRR